MRSGFSGVADGSPPTGLARSAQTCPLRAGVGCVGGGLPLHVCVVIGTATTCFKYSGRTIEVLPAAPVDGETHAWTARTAFVYHLLWVDLGRGGAIDTSALLARHVESALRDAMSDKDYQRLLRLLEQVVKLVPNLDIDP